MKQEAQTGSRCQRLTKGKGTGTSTGTGLVLWLVTWAWDCCQSPDDPASCVC